ncbi:MAG: hypothetical protein BYD32DRAFT_427126 [Podila humilis]|nr:MAG: hypothetical protein BYD32DRAFT_427126 [Podila humilis]
MRLTGPLRLLSGPLRLLAPLLLTLLTPLRGLLGALLVDRRLARTSQRRELVRPVNGHHRRLGSFRFRGITGLDLWIVLLVSRGRKGTNGQQGRNCGGSGKKGGGRSKNGFDVLEGI